MQTLIARLRAAAGDCMQTLMSEWHLVPIPYITYSYCHHAQLSQRSAATLRHDEFHAEHRAVKWSTYWKRVEQYFPDYVVLSTVSWLENEIHQRTKPVIKYAWTPTAALHSNGSMAKHSYLYVLFRNIRDLQSIYRCCRR